MTPLQRSSNEHNIAVLGSRVVLAAEELSARGRCRVSRGDVRWVYDDSGTEELFVTLGAPSRLGVAALTVITKSGGIDDDEPYYGAYVGIALFGYACRMSQDLDIDDGGVITGQIVRDADGRIDYDASPMNPTAFAVMSRWVADYAGDPDTVPALLGATERGWQQFVELAAEQLRRNLRRNGMPRRALPDDALIVDFLRLGYATRLLDEVAGERPMFKPGH